MVGDFPQAEGVSLCLSNLKWALSQLETSSPNHAANSPTKGKGSLTNRHTQGVSLKGTPSRWLRSGFNFREPGSLHHRDHRDPRLKVGRDRESERRREREKFRYLSGFIVLVWLFLARISSPPSGTSRY